VATAAALAIVASPVPVVRLARDLNAGGQSLEPPAFFSPAAVAFIRAEGLRGRVFNSQNLGGYLAWRLYPDVRVFNDSRLQAYPPAHFAEILAASESQPLWDQLVAGVDWAVLSSARPNRLSGAGRFPEQDWATVFWDEAVEVLVRRRGTRADLAARREYRFLGPRADPFLVAAGINGPDGGRIRDEAQRQREENPRGHAGAMVLCLGGDPSSCAIVNRPG
jgi:hypothetical protein